MSGWILVHLKDGRRALIDPAHIVTVTPLRGDETPAAGPRADEGPGYIVLDDMEGDSA